MEQEVDKNWNPMKDDYENKEFNSYTRGVGRDIDLATRSESGRSAASQTYDLYVTGLPLDINDNGLKNLFSPYCEVLNARIPKKRDESYSTNIGFVTVGSKKEVEKAISEVHRFQLGKNTLNVRLAISKEERKKRPPNSGSAASYNVDRNIANYALPGASDSDDTDDRPLIVPSSGDEPNKEPRKSLDALEYNRQNARSTFNGDQQKGLLGSKPYDSCYEQDKRLSSNFNNSQRNRQSGGYSSDVGGLNVDGRKNKSQNYSPHSSSDRPMERGGRKSNNFNNDEHSQFVSPNEKQNVSGSSPNASMITSSSSIVSQLNKAALGNENKQINPSNSALPCHYCRKLGSKRCHVCKTPYCSQECQKNDWPDHKLECKKMDYVNQSSEAESMLRGFEISVGDDVLQVADEDCTSQLSVYLSVINDCYMRYRREELAIGESVPMKMACYVNPNEFWLVKLMNNSADLKASLQKACKSSQVQSNLAVGDLCVVLSPIDKTWSRGLVLDIGQVTAVLLVDSGHIVNVSVDHLQHLLDEHSQLPLQAILCTLPVDPIVNNWNNESIAISNEMMKIGKTYGVETIGNEDYKTIVKLFSEDKRDISLWLVEKNISNMRKSVVKSMMMDPCIPPLLASMKAVTVVTPCEKIVQIIHADSPSQFWIMIVSPAVELELPSLVSRMTQYYDQLEPNVSPIRTDLAVAARFTDEQFYRAQVYAVDEINKIANVIFIDFGNRCQVSFSDIYPLVQDFCDFPAQAIRACLAEISSYHGSNIWPEDAKQLLMSLCNHNLTGKLLNKTTKGVIEMQLQDPNGLSVSAVLIEKGLAVLTDSKNKLSTKKRSIREDNSCSVVSSVLLPGGEAVTVGYEGSGVVVFAHRNGSVCIQISTAKTRQLLNEVETRLAHKYKNYRGPYKPFICELVAAKFEDGNFYRARVTNIEPNGTINVTFIDYGNIAETDCMNVAQLDKDLKEIAPFCITCTLRDTTCTLSVDARIVFTVLEIESDSHLVIKAGLAENGPLMNAVPNVEKENSTIINNTRNSNPVVNSSQFTECSNPGAMSKNIKSPDNADNKTPGSSKSNIQKQISLIPAQASDISPDNSSFVRVGELKKCPDVVSPNTTLLKLTSPSTLENIASPSMPQSVVNPKSLQSVSSPSLPQNVNSPSLLKNVASPSIPQNVASFSTSQNVFIVGTEQNELNADATHNGQRQPIKNQESCSQETVKQKQTLSVSAKNQPAQEQKPKKPANCGRICCSHLDFDQQVNIAFVSDRYLNVFSFQKCEELSEILSRLGETSACYKDCHLDEVVCIYSESKKQWLRARILKKINAELVTVMYVDYGFIEDADVSSVKALPKDLADIPLLAVECELEISGEIMQSTAVQSKLKELALHHNPFNMLVKGLRNGRLILRDLSHAIENYSVVKLLKNLYDEQLKMDTRHVNVSSLPVLCWPQNNESDTLVAVSHVNTPSDFYIMVLTRCEEICSRLTALLNKLCPDMNPYQPVSVGQLVCGHFMNSWYRAEVISLLVDGKFEVEFCDFGNRECLNPSLIRNVPDDEYVVTLPRQALKCRLDNIIGMNVDGAWSADAVTWMQTMCINKPFKVPEIRIDDNGILCIDLLDANGVSVCSSLVCDGMAQWPVPATFLLSQLPPQCVDQKFEALAIEVKDPSLFYIIDKARGDLMNAIDETVELLCKKPLKKPFDIRVGELCCALFSDGMSTKWYRAEVQSVPDNGFEVFFIDFGNSDIIEKHNIRPFSNSLAQWPPQAIACSLSGVQYFGRSWSKSATMWLQKEITYKHVLVNVVNRKDDVYCVDISVVGTNVSVAQSLAKTSLAKLIDLTI